jgi:hypothetical protein
LPLRNNVNFTPLPPCRVCGAHGSITAPAPPKWTGPKACPTPYAVRMDSDLSPEIAACAAASLAIGTR